MPLASVLHVCAYAPLALFLIHVGIVNTHNIAYAPNTVLYTQNVHIQWSLPKEGTRELSSPGP